MPESRLGRGHAIVGWTGTAALLAPALVALGPAAVLPAMLAVTLTTASASASPSESLDLSEDVSCFRYLIDNDYVSMYELTLEPNAVTRKHRHRHEYILVPIETAEISNEVEGAAPAVSKLSSGHAFFSPGGQVHVVRNVGKIPFHAIMIELVRDDPEHKAAAFKWSDVTGKTKFNGGTREVLFVKDGVRVSLMTLQPGREEPPRQRPKAELVVALTALDVGQGDASAKLQAGRVQWRGGRYTGTLSNNGKQVARLVLLEFN